jgi:tRNA pseudouridine13 synthase
MQRFGTASIPTHSIGLALLQSDWHRAISLIMRERPGEHLDVVAARRAWLEEKNIEKALSLMPRRVVAERCILESYKKQKGDTRNAFGALSTVHIDISVQRSLFTAPFRFHAIYVSCTFTRTNRTSGMPSSPSALRPMVTNNRFLVTWYSSPRPKKQTQWMSTRTTKDRVRRLRVSILFKTYPPKDGYESGQHTKKKSWQPPQVHTITEEDVDKYSIFDIVMPLPGKDVAFPGGALGEKYREYLRLDGLDPNNFHRRQKYVLAYISPECWLKKPACLTQRL